MTPFILNSFPAKVKTYYEPFLGGGSVFFEMLKQKRFQRAVLSDCNLELVNAFQVVQSDVDSLVKELRTARYRYDQRNYLKIRAEDPSKHDAVRMAARFIFLNKTCFNGLYRVNLNGEFNTPFGKFAKDPTVCDEPNLRAVSKALSKVKIVCGDYAEALKNVKPGDAVYFDPPYLPISKTSNFSSYNAGGFGEDQHWRLRGVFGMLLESRVHVILSNSLSDKTREMYKGFDIRELTGSRTVGGPAEYRNSVKEMMVVGTPLTQSEMIHDSP